MTRARRIGFGIAFAAALALRLAMFSRFSENYDTQSYTEVVRTVEAGGRPWDTGRYNYSPVWAGVLVALSSAARSGGASLSSAVGVLMLVVDATTSVVLYRLAGGEGRGAGAALLYFANPVAVYLSSVHRSFDAFAILFLLAAIGAARLRPVRSGAVAAALSASLLVKHVAAFHPLLFLRSRRRPGLGVVAASAPYAVFLLSFVPFRSSWPQIAREVFAYGGLGGIYGTDVLLLIPGVPFWVPRALFAAAAIAALWLLRRADIEIARASLVLFLVALVFLPGIGRQYFVWPIALGALFPGAGYLVYSVVATVALVGISGQAPGIAFLPGWYGVWWAALLWLAFEIRSLRGPARTVA
jgi:hypothetical protein